MSLSGVAKQTLEVIDRGSYVSPSGATVDLRARIDAAVGGTVLYRPEDLDALSLSLVARAAPPPRIEVTDETTAMAARRLFEVEREPRVVALNFASAKHPGGGFLGGAKAQEEDLARCSALYACLITQREYYDANRAHGSMLYTDHIIYSPDVPFFRDEHLDFLEAPFLASIITAPAPNAGEAARNGRREAGGVRATLHARAGKVLAVAAAHEHRCLVLGAWGCGVFRNDPREVAAAFAHWLQHDSFRGAFDRVVFAVYDRGKGQPNLRAFQERFGAAAD
jgi:uncharacterized protein (TIGR02452 family)